jgi:hypothetical protein
MCWHEADQDEEEEEEDMMMVRCIEDNFTHTHTHTHMVHKSQSYCAIIIKHLRQISKWIWNAPHMSMNICIYIYIVVGIRWVWLLRLCWLVSSNPNTTWSTKWCLVHENFHLVVRLWAPCAGDLGFYLPVRCTYIHETSMLCALCQVRKISIHPVNWLIANIAEIDCHNTHSLVPSDLN